MNFKKRVNGSWVDTPHYIHNTSTDTITTLPADIYVNDTTATVGLKGNMSQSSTPTPQNPIQPQETGERTGNLLQLSSIAETSLNGVTYRVQGNSLYIDGKSTAAFGIDLRGAFTLNAGTYTNQMYGFTGKRIYYSFNNDTDTMCTSDVNTYKTFTISESTTYAKALVWINKNVVFDNERIDFALFESATPKDFEPYGQYKIPISSADTTTNIYLGEVESTRRIKKLVLTGKENWSTHQSTYYITVSDYYRMYDIGSHLSVCSHYPIVQLITLPEMHYCLGGLIDGNIHSAWNGNIVFNPSPMISSLTDWKAFLAQQYANGTPVTVWYVLANETTGIVNEPLRKIGDYADEVSGISIPTIAGANTITVDTTLQPSEVTVNYKGWHPVADVHEAENGQWD